MSSLLLGYALLTGALFVLLLLVIGTQATLRRVRQVRRGLSTDPEAVVRRLATPAP